VSIRLNHVVLSVTFLVLSLCCASAQQMSEVLAEVNGDKLTRGDLEQKQGNLLLHARYQYYQTEKKALDELIEQHLLETEAHRQGITVDELLQRDIDSKVKDPSEDQLQFYYEALDSKEPYDKMRDKIRDRIREIRASRLRTTYIDNLRSKSNIVVELAPPLANVHTENAAEIEGRRDAPIQLVEFADYQCLYCQKVNPDLIKLLEEYKDKVALIYKDFPLSMHPQAKKAAEAARCAGEQGQFWEYHNLLFKDKKFETPDLKQQAQALNLDTAKFDKCLDSGEEAARVKKDQEEGTRLGLSGTPSFFLNGHFFTGAVDYSTLHKMIEQQLYLTASLPSGKSPSAAESSRR
jgi:protein-disulfide isomerase